MHTTERPGPRQSSAMLWRCGGVTCPPGQCAPGGGHDDELHRHATGAGPGVAPTIVDEVVRTDGRPLPDGVRLDMERRLGHSFSEVRIHTDSTAAESADAVAAEAYTVGSHIAFGQGRFDPDSSAGRQLLAHELAHASGRACDTPPPRGTIPISSPSAPAEESARRSAAAACSYGSPSSALRPARTARDQPPSLSRQESGVVDVARSDQVDCVRRLGGCTNTRDAGIPSGDEIHRYNEECRDETGWTGADVTPTDDECRHGAARPPSARSITVLDWGEDWNGFNLAGGVLTWGEIDATGVRDMVDQIKGTLAGPPRPECIGDLTIIGHGSPGSISVGDGTGFRAGANIGGGALDPASPAYDSGLRTTLAELTPRFCSTASVTLRGCNVGDGALGTAFVQRLADLWRVNVRAHIGTIRGGGYWTTGNWRSAIPTPRGAPR
jgi:hypothetical protein